MKRCVCSAIALLSIISLVILIDVVDLVILLPRVWVAQQRADEALLEGSRRNVIGLLLGHFHKDVLVERVALDDVVAGHFLACVGVDLDVLDAVVGLSIELVEGDLLGLGRRRIERSAQVANERRSKPSQRSADRWSPGGGRGLPRSLGRAFVARGVVAERQSANVVEGRHKRRREFFIYSSANRYQLEPLNERGG